MRKGENLASSPAWLAGAGTIRESGSSVGKGLHSTRPVPCCFGWRRNRWKKRRRDFLRALSLLYHSLPFPVIFCANDKKCFESRDFQRRKKSEEEWVGGRNFPPTPPPPLSYPDFLPACYFETVATCCPPFFFPAFGRRLLVGGSSGLRKNGHAIIGWEEDS